MAQQSIKVRSIDYHRNGICGIGFYVMEWIDPEHGHMIGTVFTHHSGKEVWEVNESELHYSVITPMNMDQKWRGDHYIYAMVSAIKEYAEQYKTK